MVAGGTDLRTAPTNEMRTEDQQASKAGINDSSQAFEAVEEHIDGDVGMMRNDSVRKTKNLTKVSHGAFIEADAVKLDLESPVDVHNPSEVIVENDIDI